MEEAEKVAQQIGIPVSEWAKQCHAISLAIVKAGVYGTSRVARGRCTGVGSQHSWVIVGIDCYSSGARIVDPTLWSYDERVTDIWHGTNMGRHVPHGAGSIWQYGQPAPPADEGDVVMLHGQASLSTDARRFLELAAPKGLDRRGWALLANAPVEGWPAAEIIEAIYKTPVLSALVPIDIVGMLTDLNPEGLYLP